MVGCLRICGLWLDLVEGWICGFVIVVCLRICGRRWVVVAGGVCGGLRGGLAVMVPFPVVLGFVLFYVAPNT